MREKKGRYGRSLLLLTLFLGVSFGIFFNMATTADATPSLSPDGKTCTPCHEAGGPGGAGGSETGKPAEQPQKPVETPPVEQTPEPKPPVKEPASPVLVIGLVAVVLGVIYVVAIKKKH